MHRYFFHVVNNKSAMVMPKHNVGLTLSYSFIEQPFSRIYRKDAVQAEMKVSACTVFIVDGRKEK